MPEAELHFENVRVHEKWLLQPPSGLSQGFSDLMAAYNSQRVGAGAVALGVAAGDRKSTRLNSSHANISYAVFCLKKKRQKQKQKQTKTNKQTNTLLKQTVLVYSTKHEANLAATATI